MAGFTKLFSSITDSTIWNEPDKIRIVWITMLASADQNGEVLASVPGLAVKARVDIEDCVEALEKLKAPDEWSRTKDFEGRRIEEIDGGWLLLNHEKYRAMRSKIDRNEYQRQLMATRRKTDAKKKPAKAKPKPKTTPERKEQIDALYQLYPLKKARPEALRAIDKALDKADFDAIKAGLERYIRELSRPDAPRAAYPATWYNQERWTDEETPVMGGLSPDDLDDTPLEF